MKNVSVIIRNKNEERWIGHAIQSALEFLDEPEIIIIDNSSTDESMQIVKSFRHDSALEKEPKKYSTVRSFNIEDYSPGAALNLGVKMASCEIILILSAHSVITHLDGDSIQSKLRENAAVFGRQIPVYRGRKITPRYLWSHFLDHDVRNMYSELEGRYFLHNAACFYNRSDLCALPFDEQITGKEDRIWAKACIANAKSFLYTPDLTIHHHYTANGNTWKGVG